MERRLRTISKTITWRILATITTIVIIYLFEHNIKLSLSLGISLNVVKALIYYVHERVWNRISFGKLD